MEEALDRLAPAERQVVVLHIVGDLPFRQIARLMNMPQGTVAWHYRNALQKLRRYDYA